MEVVPGGGGDGAVCSGLGGFQLTDFGVPMHVIVCGPAMATEPVSVDGMASGRSQEDPLASSTMPGCNMLETS